MTSLASFATLFLQNYLLLKSLIKCVVHISNQILNCSRFDAPCKLRCTSSPNFPQIDFCSTLQFVVNQNTVYNQMCCILNLVPARYCQQQRRTKSWYNTFWICSLWISSFKSKMFSFCFNFQSNQNIATNVGGKVAFDKVGLPLS